MSRVLISGGGSLAIAVAAVLAKAMKSEADRGIDSGVFTLRAGGVAPEPVGIYVSKLHVTPMHILRYKSKQEMARKQRALQVKCRR